MIFYKFSCFIFNFFFSTTKGGLEAAGLVEVLVGADAVERLEPVAPDTGHRQGLGREGAVAELARAERGARERRRSSVRSPRER